MVNEPTVGPSGVLHSGYDASPRKRSRGNPVDNEASLLLANLAVGPRSAQPLGAASSQHHQHLRDRARGDSLLQQQDTMDARYQREQRDFRLGRAGHRDDGLVSDDPDHSGDSSDEPARAVQMLSRDDTVLLKAARLRAAERHGDTLSPADVC